MRKIFLSAGHSTNPARDRGAVSGQYVEGVLAAELRRLIYEHLRISGADVSMDIDDTVLGDSVRFFQKITTPESIVMDIHFNAGPPTATGVETFVSVSPSYFEKKLAQAISYTTAATLSIPSRGNEGVKLETESQHKNGLGWMRLQGQNILLEVCFISNPKEIKNYEADKHDLAKNIAATLLAFAKEPSGLPQFTAADPVSYTIRQGDTLSKIAAQYATTANKIMGLNNMTDTRIYAGKVIRVK